MVAQMYLSLVGKMIALQGKVGRTRLIWQFIICSLYLLCERVAMITNEDRRSCGVGKLLKIHA